MLKDPSGKYRPFPPVHLPDRQWPNRTLTHAPIWCSVDLRDGNQALAVPMNVGQKLELFQMLVKCGFKEIEVGFPSASNTEFTFNRRLIEEHRAPDDVWLQVLVQAREDLIERTFESLAGAKKAIIHLYNSTSPAQRRVVFGMSKEEILGVAVRGAKWIQERLPQLEGHRSPAPVLAGELQRHRSRVRQGSRRSRDGRLEAHAAAQDDPQPPRHGRSGHAQRLRRPDRMDLPQHQEPRLAHRSACTRTTTAAPAWRPPSWACSPAPTAWKARSSATASAPATSTS